MNIIEIKYLRNGNFKERTTILSDVPIKQSEGPKEYIRRILTDGNVTDVHIKEVGMMKDKGHRP